MLPFLLLWGTTGCADLSGSWIGTIEWEGQPTLAFDLAGGEHDVWEGPGSIQGLDVCDRDGDCYETEIHFLVTMYFSRDVFPFPSESTLYAYLDACAFHFPEQDVTVEASCVNVVVPEQVDDDRIEGGLQGFFGGTSRFAVER